MQHKLAMDVQITPFSSKQHIDEVTTLWHSLLPGYAIARSRLHHLLEHESGNHYVAYESSDLISGGIHRRMSMIGFVATHLATTTYGEKKGYISVVLIDKAYQGQGKGKEMVNVACNMLLDTSLCDTIVIGSVFPRFWPGVPTDIPRKDQDFFLNLGKRHGLRLSEEELCWDLNLDLGDYHSPKFVVQRAAEAGITFSPLTEEGYEECARKQDFNFDNDGWVAAYKKLKDKGLFDQIMVACGTDGKQVGWALMIEPDLPVWDELACPSLLGGRTGLIACVGVDKTKRGAGVGLALVAKAAEDLKRRGMNHVFVDWVVLKKWYEKLGFTTWREYRTLVWRREDQAEQHDGST